MFQGGQTPYGHNASFHGLISLQWMIIHFSFATGFILCSSSPHPPTKLSRCVWSQPSLAPRMFLSGSHHLRTFLPTSESQGILGVVSLLLASRRFFMLSAVGWKAQVWAICSSPLCTLGDQRDFFLKWSAYFLGVELTSWWEIICLWCESFVTALGSLAGVLMKGLPFNTVDRPTAENAQWPFLQLITFRVWDRSSSPVLELLTISLCWLLGTFPRTVGR